MVSPDNADTSTVPHHVPEIPHSDGSVRLCAAVDDSELGQRSIVSATAELLRGVRDSTHAFVPLKSIAGHLYSILENCQVWPPTCTVSPQCLWSFQITETDGPAVELLAPRVKALSELLCAPTHPGDINEKQREKKLKQ